MKGRSTCSAKILNEYNEHFEPNVFDVSLPAETTENRAMWLYLAPGYSLLFFFLMR